jgi:hypothetical protein
MKSDVAPLAIKTEANNPNPERLEATPMIPLMVRGVVEAETIRLATTEDHCGTIFFAFVERAMARMSNPKRSSSHECVSHECLIFDFA